MSQLGNYLSQNSLWFILLGLVLSELGLPLPETVFVVAAGVVSQQHGLGLALPVVACTLAVLLGDLTLFLLARRFGTSAFKRWPLRLLVPERAYPRIDALLSRHGPMAVFVARFLAGVRGATFALAGMRGMPLGRFLLWDGLAILLTVPIFAVLGFMFSSSAGALRAQVEQVNFILLGLLAVVVVGYAAHVISRSRRAPKASATNVEPISR